jgi:hypothetical protein
MKFKVAAIIVKFIFMYFHIFQIGYNLDFSDCEFDEIAHKSVPCELKVQDSKRKTRNNDNCTFVVNKHKNEMGVNSRKEKST